MKKILMVVMCCFMFGCAEKNVCDTRGDQPSYLCEAADTSGINLSTAGNILMVANLASIDEGFYTKDDAIEAFSTVRKAVEMGGSYRYILTVINSVDAEKKGLLVLSGIILDKIDRPQIITKFDKELLINWLDEQIEIMGSI